MPIRPAQDKQKIIPHLWFDKEAQEAAAFYTTIFPNSNITSSTTLKDTPSGDTDVVSFELDGYKFMAISAGPLFKFNPSISFMVGCKTITEVDELWGKLSEGGKALMELDEYPFSKKYGWTEDKYGVSWQIMHVEGNITQKITPSFLFVGDKVGQAEEAINFYASVFHNAKVGDIARYPKEVDPEKEGMVMYADVTLEGQHFAAMDGDSREHNFTFNEAISLIVSCDNQAEIDYYWEKLSAVPESEQCGWLKDKYGVSWQIVPMAMNEMMSKGTPEQIERVTRAFLAMKKFNVEELENAYKGQ